MHEVMEILGLHDKTFCPYCHRLKPSHSKECVINQIDPFKLKAARKESIAIYQKNKTKKMIFTNNNRTTQPQSTMMGSRSLAISKFRRSKYTDC